MNFQLISALVRGVWLIDSDIAENYYPAVSLLLSGQPAEFDFPEFQLKIYNPSGRTDVPSTSDYADHVEPGAVVSIPIKGALMKEDQMCGPVGMKTIGEIIQQADNNPDIKGLVLNIDSPGGTVDGTRRLADIIKNTKKPTVAYVDGMAASAAYWIASAADSIVAEPRSTIGSVGVMLSFADMQPALEREGVKFHQIVSNLSPDKNSLIEQVRAGNYEEYRKNVLDPLATDFKNSLIKNRPQITPEQMTGKTWYADDLVGTMIDRIGTIEDAVNLINNQPEPKLTFNNKKQLKMAQFENLNRLLNIESIEMEDEGAYLNLEQLEAINAALSTAPAGNDKPEPTPKPEPAPAPAPEPVDMTNPPEFSEPAMQIINDLRARLEAVENGAGATSASVAPSADPGKQNAVKLASDPKASFWENVNKVKEAYL
ncbi:MAG: S49 family peptidase [Bacteroidia bacterium]|nr:S49 family peptidase [Bacteroidia bacterium]